MNSKTVNDKKELHEIGYNSITHNGTTHPIGEQICFNCGKTLVELIENRILFCNLELIKNLKKQYGLTN